MTAGALDEDRERCFAAGMDDYISKPVDLATLAEVLSRWVPQTSTADVGGVDAAAAADVPQQQAAAPASNSVVLELERLQILRELGPADGLGLLPEAVRAFRQDSQGALDTLRAALENGQAAELEAAAHKLAGAAANIGAVGAAGLCKELERLGRDAGPELGSTGALLLDQLNTELAHVDEALERTLTEAHSPGAP